MNTDDMVRLGIREGGAVRIQIDRQIHIVAHATAKGAGGMFRLPFSNGCPRGRSFASE